MAGIENSAVSTGQLLKESRRLALAGSFPEALSLARTARSTAPASDIATLVHLFWVLARSGAHSDVEKEAEEALITHPDNRAIVLFLLDSLIGQKKFSLALEKIEKIYSINSPLPRDFFAEILRRVVICKSELNDWRGAMRDALHALQLEPSNIQILTIYRRICQNERKTHLAAEAYLRAIEHSSEQVSLIGDTLELLIEANNVKKAVEVGRNALNRGIKNEKLYRRITEALLILEEFEDARHIARAAIARIGYSAFFWKTIIEASVRLGDVSAAADAAIVALAGAMAYPAPEIEWIVENLKQDQSEAQRFVRSLLKIRPLEPWISTLGRKVGLKLDENINIINANDYRIEICGIDSCWEFMLKSLHGLNHRGFNPSRGKPIDRPVNLFYIRSARIFVLPNGFFIFSPNGFLVDQYAPHINESMIEAALKAPVQGIFHELFFIGDRHAPHNYAHWTVDYLPRAAVADVFCKDFPIGIPHLRGGGFHAGTLENIGISSNKCISLGVGLYEVSHLAFLNTSSQEAAHSFHGGNRYYASIMTSRANISKRNFSERVFLDRAAGATRQIVNRAEILPILQDFGFMLIDPGSLLPIDQVTLMAQANVVIGPHGAGLANIAYCRPGTKVLEIWHPFLGNPAFVKAAFVANSTYSYLLSQPPSSLEAAGSSNPSLRNYAIDAKGLRRWLEDLDLGR